VKIGTFELIDWRKDPDFVDEGFDYFINAHSVPVDGVFYHCPCCRYPTLPSRGRFEVCPICFWEDDGQDDHDAQRVRGGPNGAMSLAASRLNFARIGACEPSLLSVVRMPIPKEKRYRKMTADILTRTEGHAGIITLNRASALHALTLEMVHAVRDALLTWARDDQVRCIIIDHAEGTRGFCAGGDISMLRDSALNDGGVSGRRFFHDEYQLNHLLFTYPKPVVAFMDGITMGGGVGLSQPAQFRVATENTKFAMPETGIGLFPDVGGGWYLSRLEGRVGAYLALTGARLDGAECDALNLATHYLPSEVLAEAKNRIAHDDPERIDGILGMLAVKPPEPKILDQLIPINQHFASNSFEEILASLQSDDSNWAMKEQATVRTKSPQTCKVALRQLAESLAFTDFADNMRMEYRIAARVITRPDFAEGVRAVIVDKDNAPQWDPAQPEGVTDDLIESIFARLPENEEWTPL
jgi:enoyl-CoA hydratase